MSVLAVSEERPTCRFWYETEDELLRFSPGQLAEIRKSSLSSLLCR